MPEQVKMIPDQGETTGVKVMPDGPITTPTFDTEMYGEFIQEEVQTPVNEYNSEVHGELVSEPEPIDNPKAVLGGTVDFAEPLEEMQAGYDKHVLNVIGQAIGEEGGYVNDPNDKGGPTKFGIALNYNRDELTKLGIPATAAGMQSLTQEQAIQIYKNKYWTRGKLDTLPRDMQFDFFTAFINGEGRAVKALQGMVGADVDGVMGPQTAGMLQDYLDNPDNRETFGELYKMEYLLGLADNAGTWSNHANGWANRYLETDEFGSGKIDLRSMSRREARDLFLERKAQFLNSRVGPPVEGAEGGEEAPAPYTPEGEDNPFPSTTPAVTPKTLEDGIYEDPETGKPIRMQGGRMYDLRTGERLDVDPVQDTGPDVGTIREGKGGYEKRTLEGSVQDNLAGSGNASPEEVKTFIKEMTGANLGPNVKKALEAGDAQGAVMEVAFEALGPLGDMARSMFIGVKSATNASRIPSKMREGLFDATEQLKQGVDPEAVRQATGWHKGPDGKMRFEISDAPAKIKTDPSTMAHTKFSGYAPRPDQGIPLTEVLDHPELFKEYPGMLSEYKVVTFDKANPHHGSKGGFHSSSAKVIAVKEGTPPEELRSTLLHEIQHAIQRYEGFTGGASYRSFMDQNQLEMALGARDNVAAMLDSYKPFAKVGEAGGRMEQLLKQNPFAVVAMEKILKGKPLEARNLIMEWKRVGVPLGEPDSFYLNLNRMGRELIENNPEDIPAITNMITQSAKGLEESSDIAARIKYYSNAGEAEARLVQARADMPAEDLWLNDPNTMWDIPMEALTDEAGNKLL